MERLRRIQRKAGGILLSAVQALEQRTAELQQKEVQVAGLAAQVDDLLHAKLASVETVVTRLEALEQRKHRALQITAENSPAFVRQGE
jgi:DNA repair exonuclease SbcCD ATPase subunit